jgi:hypothetical protein
MNQAQSSMLSALENEGWRFFKLKNSIVFIKRGNNIGTINELGVFRGFIS